MNQKLQISHFIVKKINRLPYSQGSSFKCLKGIISGAVYLNLKFFRADILLYSISCDLSAVPAPGQSAGSSTRPTLIETK
jgi:hypothetical protein